MRNIIVDIINSFFYILYFIIKEDFVDYINRLCDEQPNQDKRVHVLANGPSLNTNIDFFKANWNTFQKDDFCGINFLACLDCYTLFKPMYYVLSDPKFFITDGVDEKVKQLYIDIEQKTSWKMYLFVPYSQFKKTRINNINVVVIPFHYRPYIGLESLRHFFYRKGLGNGEFGTVVLNAEYFLINIGYKHIYLYGVDHTYFNGLIVLDNNKVRYKYSHVGEDAHYSPVSIGPKVDVNMHTYLLELYNIFHGHTIMNKYAEAMNCEILNCTKGSFIDSYRRCLQSSLK